MAKHNLSEMEFVQRSTPTPAPSISGEIGRKRSPDGFKLFLKALYVVSFLAYGYLVYYGLDYYRTAYRERPRHEQYRTLRPAGDVGHGYGIIGSAMMLFMLLYSVRKRTRLLGRWGSLNRWLDIHIYFGIMGPLLVILHSAFKVNGLIAVSFWSMIAVALSGVLGRYLYLQIPRNRLGDVLSLKEARALDKKLTSLLMEELHLHEDQLLALQERIIPPIDPESSLINLLFHMIMQDLLRPFHLRRLKRVYHRELGLDGELLKLVVAQTYQKSVLERRIAALNRVQQLFHYWHVFHKPFAIIMYLIMLVHVGISIWLGYTWIW